VSVTLTHLDPGSNPNQFRYRAGEGPRRAELAESLIATAAVASPDRDFLQQHNGELSCLDADRGHATFPQFSNALHHGPFDFSAFSNALKERLYQMRVGGDGLEVLPFPDEVLRH
jgi:hypothetical protein